MSVVKRPALVTNIFPMNNLNETPSEPPSKVSQIKSETVALYLSNHLNQIVKNTEEREKRRHELANSDLPPEQIEQNLKQFDQQETELSRLYRTRLKPDRFERIALIGRGGFGSVWLVREKSTLKYYALKVLRKADIINTEQIANVRTERDALATPDNPWIANLQYSFQDENHLYLVLEFVQGGDFMNLLIKRSYLSEKDAKFFCGEIALALQSIHSQNLIHLDLKPDNILISTTGHLKLTDFGLAAYYSHNDARFQHLLSEIQDYVRYPNKSGEMRHRDRTNLVVSCDYTAPEILNREPATPAADWWSFGVIFYEMLFGYTPFYSETVQQTAINVINWKKTLRFPTSPPISPEARELLGHLLCSAQERWGYNEVVNSQFFKANRGVPAFNFENPNENIPPFIPALKSPIDTTFFDPPQTLSEDPLPELPIAQDLAKFAFLGFTFKKDLH